MKEKLFKLSDIKAGYLLVVRDDGETETYTMTVIPNALGKLGCVNPGKHWYPLDHFGDALRYHNSEIEAVYGPTANRYLLDNSTEHRDLLWSRPVEQDDEPVEQDALFELKKALLEALIEKVKAM